MNAAEDAYGNDRHQREHNSSGQQLLSESYYAIGKLQKIFLHLENKRIKGMNVWAMQIRNFIKTAHLRPRQ